MLICESVDKKIMNSISFQLVTPDRTVLSKELDSLSCPTAMGQITILPQHEALVATLAPGELHAKAGTEDFYIHVEGGFVEVKAGSKVVVLADAAQHHYEIDVKKTEEAVQRAKTAMTEERLSVEEYARVAALLSKNLSRLNVAKKHSHRRSQVPGKDNI